MGTLRESGSWDSPPNPHPPCLLEQVGGRACPRRRRTSLPGEGMKSVGAGQPGRGVSFHAAEAAELPRALPSGLGSQAELRWSGP